MTLNICFLSPASPTPSGGVKVIYRLAELIDKSYAPTIQAEICSVHNPRFRCEWFEHNVKSRGGYKFDSASDFLIIPEYMAGYIGDALLASHIRYAIFVQGGYIICENHSIEVLAPIYEAAQFVISISKDTTNCVKLFFPDVSNKILQYRYILEGAFSSSLDAKDNLITYMPRKIASHSRFVISALTPQLPASWEISPIHNLSEFDVSRVLSRSRVFLSFSDQEGLGIPPIEAALSGNIVIGYHGEGGREYWKTPLFIEIQKGNLIAFVHRTLELIHKIDKRQLVPSDALIAELRDQYSLSNQGHYLAAIVKSVIEAMNDIKKPNRGHKVNLSRYLGKPGFLRHANSTLRARLTSLVQRHRRC